MSADALSDLLEAIRLTGAVFFDCSASSPWVAEQPPREEILPKILPGADHLIAYHIITEGRCFASMIGGPTTELEAGDVIVFTGGDPHVLSSSPGMRAGPPALGSLEGQLPFLLSYGPDGHVSAKFVCGFLACDTQPYNLLFRNLPAMLTVKDRAGDEAGWLSQFIRLAATESASRRAGGESVLARLSELMFIEVVRRYIDTLPTEGMGLLAGLRDPFIAKALSLLHADSARSWTIEELGRQVGMSRSVLAERFTSLLGIPPIQYLAHWRMQKASAQLRGGTASVASVAAQAGYGSEAAFSRAFKKMIGHSPSAWRRARGFSAA